MPALRRLLPAFIVLVIAIATNWLWLQSEQIIDQRTVYPFDERVPWLDDRVERAAGFPWTYWIRFEYSNPRSDLVPSTSHGVFDGTRLFGNIALWALLLAFTFWYTGPRRRGDDDDASATEPRRFMLSDLAILITVIALGLAYYSWMRKTGREQEGLASRIEQAGGMVDISVNLPAPLAWLVKGRYEDWLTPMYRITGVTIDNPNKALVDEIVVLPKLQRFRLSGDSYPLESLQPLVGRFGLEELRISGRELDDSTVELIGRLKSLQSINLMRTNLHCNGLIAWGFMPRLRYLHLVHSDVSLDVDEPIAALESVRGLLLPRPPRGKSMIHRTVRLPELREIICTEYDERINNTPVQLTVEDCPKLQRIAVDAIQRLDLELRRLPLLRKLETIQFLIGERVRQKSIVPDGVWVRKAVFDDLPTLETIPLFVRNLEEIEIRGCDRSSLDATSLGGCFVMERRELVPVGQLVQHTQPFMDSGSVISDTDDGAEPNPLTWLLPSTEETQHMINVLSNVSSLSTLSLTHRDLSQIDFSPLAQCKSLRSIDLSMSKFVPSQLAPLADLEQLESLQLAPMQDSVSEDLMMAAYSFVQRRRYSESPRGSKDLLAEILATLPNLRTVAGDTNDLGKFDIENHEAIESVFQGRWGLADQVNVVGNPKLKDTVILSPVLQNLVIRGNPQIRGLLTHRPWDGGWVVEDCDQLRFLAVGGEKFSDPQWLRIGDLQHLESLTVAHAPLSEASLQRIGESAKLKALCAYGCKVNDSVVGAWNAIRDLEMLDLRETQITAESLAWIRSQSSLKQLAIDYAVLQGASSDTLDFLGRLERLTLRGGTLDAASLEAWPPMLSLQEWRLEMMDVPVDTAIVLAGRKLPGLRFLDLDRCTVDLTNIGEWLQQRVASRVVCSIHETVIPADIEDEMVQRGQAGRVATAPYVDVTEPGFESIKSFGEESNFDMPFEYAFLRLGADIPWIKGRTFLVRPELFSRSTMSRSLFP